MLVRPRSEHGAATLLVAVAILSVTLALLAPGPVASATTFPPGQVTVLASLASDGSQADAPSYQNALSGDGRFVAFFSDADNLVPGDTNGVSDLFVRDLQTAATTRVSVASDGTEGNAASGHTFAIWVDTPALSSDGRYVAFTSDASNLVSGDTNGFADDTNFKNDVFVHDVLAAVGRPDARIALGAGPLLGDQHYGVDGARQTKKVTVERGAAITFRMSFQNDSDDSDRLTLGAVGPGPGFHVRYFLGTADVTAQVVAGTRRTRVLAAGESVTYTMRVRVKATAAPGALGEVLVIASSNNQPAIEDAVRADVTAG